MGWLQPAVDHQPGSVQDATTERMRSDIVEIQARVYDKAASYFNIIILAGYAGIFFVWTQSSEFLSKNAVAICALLMVISVLTFVLFEIAKMTFFAYTIIRFKGFILDPKSPFDIRQNVENFHRVEKQA